MDYIRIDMMELSKIHNVFDVELCYVCVCVCVAFNALSDD